MLIAVVAHLFIAGWHGLTHHLTPVPLTVLQMAFIGIVIIGQSFAGLVLSYTRHATQGAALVFVSMLASLVFGIVNHFILISVENVWCVPDVPWRTAFVSSAVLVAVSEVFGTLAGGTVLWRLMHARTS